MINKKAIVRYIREDTPEDKACGFYPPIGTLGVVESIGNGDIEVRWDKGTKGEGLWWCSLDDVEVVYNPKVDCRIFAVRLFYAENHITMAEMLFSNERSAVIPWNARNASYIDANTFIYDERINKPFEKIKEAQKIWRT